MRSFISIVLILMFSSVYSQTVKKEKIYPRSDTTKAEGTVYRKANVMLNVKADISAAMYSVETEIKNEHEEYVHVEKVIVELNYNKTTQNSKGVYKTVERKEKTKLEDVIIKPHTSIFFKETDKLDKNANYGVLFLEGEIDDDEVTLLKPSNRYKKKLNETPTVCGGFYSVEFSIYVKQVKTEEAYLEDGSPAYRFIPFLVLENKSKKDVSFKGDLEVVFTYNGLQRQLKFNLPNVKSGDTKEREAKGDIPIVNFIPDVYFIQMLNTPDVTIKD